MKKKVFGRKLGRERSTRRALFRSLIRAFVRYGKIETTKAKAKSILPDIDKLIKLVKSKEVPKIRQVYSYLGNDKKTVDLLLKKVAVAFEKRKSGFTRLVNLPRRKGDNAEVVRLEWVEKIEIEEKTKDKGKKSKKGGELKPEEKAKSRKTLKERLKGLTKKSAK